LRAAGALAVVILALAAPFSASAPQEATLADWPFYGGDAGGTRYSSLAEINRSNVTSSRSRGSTTPAMCRTAATARPKSAFETTPVVAHGTMYFITPFNRVIALDPESGKEKWSFDPKIDLRTAYSEGLINRGVSLWRAPQTNDDEACNRRVFYLLSTERRTAGAVGC
jgi:quinoprotein glucose dehydrogenase